MRPNTLDGEPTTDHALAAHLRSLGWTGATHKIRNSTQFLVNGKTVLVTFYDNSQCRYDAHNVRAALTH